MKHFFPGSHNYSEYNYLLNILLYICIICVIIYICIIYMYYICNNKIMLKNIYVQSWTQIL